MRKKSQKYKITIALLLFVIVLEGIVIISLLNKKAETVGEKVTPSKGKIAIVIDDWGYSLNDVHLLDGLDLKVTMAILPNLPYSQPLAEEFNRRGYEIILHQPMEPDEKKRLEKNTITTSMSPKQITGILERNILHMPFVKGVSNHMGSKVTGDERTMSVIMGELQKGGLYFLDSRVSSRSVCRSVAERLRIGYAQRTMFLDNSADAEYIKQMFRSLQRQTRILGQAIGICHCKKVTLEVLQEVLPQIKKEGFELVFVSEILS